MMDYTHINTHVARVIAKSENATYVTYNCGDKFDPEKFVEIKNSVVPTSRGLGLDSSKPLPKTGLWATYEDEDGYLKLCKEMGRPIKSSFKFKLSDNARILHLFNKHDVETAMDYYNAGVLTLIQSYACLNFEAIAKDYDVIHCHMNDEICHPEFNYMLDGLYFALYGWDFDSILVMNKDVVVPL